jgi:hypothetical protein
MWARIKELKDYEKNALIGSFAEWLFCSSARKAGMRIDKAHADRADFAVNGERMDVKGHVIEKEDLDPPRPWSGKRQSRTRYVMVEFWKKGARVSIEGNEISEFDLESLAMEWSEWSKNHTFKLPTVDKSQRKRDLAQIRNEIREFFREHERDTRIIYRTCQKEFGNEYPHNLRPQKIQENRVTVFLSFESCQISKKNIDGIVVIPDDEPWDLPMTKNFRLHAPKVDIEKLPTRFRFKNIEDLKTRYSPTV